MVTSILCSSKLMALALSILLSGTHAFLTTQGGPVKAMIPSSSRLHALPLEEVTSQASLMLSTTTENLSALTAATAATTTSWISQAAAVAATAAPGALNFGLWFSPILFYMRGLPLTVKFLKVLDKIDPDSAGYEPDFQSADIRWENIEKIPGGKDGAMQHIKWGCPSLAMYLIASYGFFPGHENEFFHTASVALVIPAGLTLCCSLAAAFKVMGGIPKLKNQESAIIVTIVLVAMTLPYIQLVPWEIEYALRYLLHTPTETVLPDFFLTLITKTNIVFPILVKPVTYFFNWNVFPEDFSASGVAVVQSIVNANAYIQDPSGLTPEVLNSINSGLFVQNVYGTLAIIPMWSILTNFGLWKVTTPFSRCMFSKAFLAIVHQENWAQQGIWGMLGLYWILSFGWLLWGVEINSVYLG